MVSISASSSRSDRESSLGERTRQARGLGPVGRGAVSRGPLRGGAAAGLGWQDGGAGGRLLETAGAQRLFLHLYLGDLKGVGSACWSWWSGGPGGAARDVAGWAVGQLQGEGLEGIVAAGEKGGGRLGTCRSWGVRSCPGRGLRWAGAVTVEGVPSGWRSAGRVSSWQLLFPMALARQPQYWDGCWHCGGGPGDAERWPSPRCCLSFGLWRQGEGAKGGGEGGH